MIALNRHKIVLDGGALALKILFLSGLLCTGQAGAQVLLQAEDYVNFFDTTAGNTGGAYRNNNVDIQACSDSGCGYNVGWIANGEWLEYNLNVAAGIYVVNTRVASETGGGGFRYFLNGQEYIGRQNVGATGGWQNWITLTSTQVSINGGSHVLRLLADSGNFNLNWIQVTPVGGGSSSSSSSSSNSSSSSSSSTSSSSNSSSSSSSSSSTGGPALVWSDEFNGSGQPNSSNWNYHVGNGWNSGAGGFAGWGNGEWEWYRPGNAYQQNGNLVLRVDYNSAPTHIAGRDWSQFSSRLTTKGKRTWRYGRIEARIALPNVYGLWPAFWMMGNTCDDTTTGSYAPASGYYDTMATNWSSCGEIDILEHVNTNASYIQNLFWDTRIGLFPWADGMNGNVPNTASLSNPSQFHVYRIDWDPTFIRWFRDGMQVYAVNITPQNMEEFHRPFHLILNVAVSGAVTGNAHPDPANFPAYMYVDYVRVYQ